MNRYKLSKAGISVKEGIARFNGSREIYESVLMTFLEDRNYAELLDAIEKKEVESAFAAAHSLKGVCGNLSMSRLFDDVVPLVELLRAGSFEKVEELLAPVTKDYEDVVAALNQGDRPLG